MARFTQQPIAMIGIIVASLLVGAGGFALLTSGGGDSDATPTATSSADGTASPTSTSVVPGGSGGPASVEDSLVGLGVDTTASDRVDPDSEPLPDNYSPLGSSPSFGDSAVGSSESGLNKTDELLLVGFEAAATGSRLSLVEQLGVQIDGSGDIDPGTTEVLQSFDADANAWVAATGARNGDSNDQRSLRALTAGDVDRDGFEEIIVVYVDTSAADRVLKLQVIEDLDAGFASSEATLGDGDDILEVAVLAGDFNGDGTAQIAVGLGFEASAELRFIEASGGGYAVDDALTKTYGISFDENTTVTLELAAGNIDYDNPDELGLVVNELATGFNGGIQGASTLYLYDDALTGYTLLEDGPVQGRDGAVVTAVVSDLAFGDVDGDGLDELVVGGLAEFNTSCDPYDAFVAVRDDLEHDLAALDTDTFNAFFSNCPAFGPWRLRFLHIGAFDLDGDGYDEVHANLRVYEDLTETAELTLIQELPQSVFVDRDDDAGAHISAATTTIATGDVTGDGRENLIVYAQWQPDLHIWGLSAIESVGFAELSTIDVADRFNTQGRPEPVVLPVNLDTDSPALKYSDGEYQLVFTEPLVVAALAAAPCAEGIGQNLGACSTAFGQGETEAVAAELTVTVKAGIHTGFEVNGSPMTAGIGGSLKESVTLTASASAGTAYTVEKSRTFTTGSLEDGVVFTTIPYDRYTYTVLSHPDPQLVGTSVIVSLPREPIILKVDRDFYNANVVESSIRIDEQVFDHLPGTLDSYPSVGRKNELLGRYGGLENGPISVGQGGGSSGLEIAVSTEVSLGGSLGIEYEKEVEVTGGGALAGYTVGYGAEASLSVTSGSQTTYAVEVGDLDADNFSANQFSYGIFTYVQELGGQEFEVINIWVE